MQGNREAERGASGEERERRPDEAGAYQILSTCCSLQGGVIFAVCRYAQKCIVYLQGGVIFRHFKSGG